jgi:non-heme chloroperoxidase
MGLPLSISHLLRRQPSIMRRSVQIESDYRCQSRRVIMKSVDIGGMRPTNPASVSHQHARAQRSNPFIEANDGTRLFNRDWGVGAPVVFCHPWGLNADIFEYQLTALSEQGVRCVAFDRRGHGRSDDPGDGYDLDSLAADLAAVIETLDLRDVTLVGYSMGSAEVIRYVSRYGADRVSRVLLTSPLPPAGGDPSSTNAFVEALAKDRPATLAYGLPLFVGHDLVSPALAQWVLDQFLRSSPKAGIECQRANVISDYRADLKFVNVPTLIITGDADEVCPLDKSGRKIAEAIPGSELRIYEGAPHGIVLTHRDRFTDDLLRFITG